MPMSAWPARMHVRRFSTHIEVLTPAKVNLYLEVLTRRADGFHEIDTVMAGVSIYDSLRFEAIRGSEIRLNCRWGLGCANLPPDANGDLPHEPLYSDIPGGSENLVWRAVELLRKAGGLERGASIELVKRIPAAAGLGGGSSDAAAALVAANYGWNLNLPQEQLRELAAELGSDVPFFLSGLSSGGAARCRGRGG